jgi:hypothetical protein
LPERELGQALVPERELGQALVPERELALVLEQVVGEVQSEPMGSPLVPSSSCPIFFH